MFSENWILEGLLAARPVQLPWQQLGTHKHPLKIARQ